MSKISLSLTALIGSFLAFGCSSPDSRKADLDELINFYPQSELDTTKHGADSTELIMTNFAGPDIVPSPAALAVSPNGNVFVGVDMMGSLGKEPGKGAIVRLVDSNNDGKLDSHTEFVKVDNPRGIIAVRDQVYVLHTQFSEETGLIIEVKAYLFVHEYLAAPLHAMEHFFSVEKIGGNLALGTDPELYPDSQIIEEVKWMDIKEIRSLPKQALHQIFWGIKSLEDLVLLRGYFNFENNSLK